MTGCVSFCKDGFGSVFFAGGCINGTDCGSGYGIGCGSGIECLNSGGSSCDCDSGCDNVFDCMITSGIGATNGGLINKQGWQNSIL